MRMALRTKRVLLGLAVFGVGLGLLGLSGTRGCGLGVGASSCTRVLFIGNSYTFVNDLPGTFASLARSGGHRVEVGMVADGGWTFAQHVASSATSGAIGSKPWNFIVLQEQSQIPSVPALREAQMYPAARQLVTAIRAGGAQPVFFETWAHRDGWREEGIPDYAGMQAAIDDGYREIAQEQDAALAPVGAAWSAALGQGDLTLWQDDGSHPTVAGTYLAACVFYTVIFGRSPEGLSYRAGLSAGDAALLQSIAAGSV
jgi:hypothetical protein